MTQLLLDAAAVVLFAEVIAHQVDARVGRRLPRQRAADRIQIAIVDAAVVVGVEGIAVALQIRAGDADAERIGDRQVEHRLRALRIVIAIFEFARGMDAAEIGLGGDEVDDARRCVAAEQRALRPAQHFDAFEVEEFAFEQAGRGERHVVDVDRRRLIARYADAQVADAADREAGGRIARFREGDAGQRLLQRDRVDDLLLFDVVGGKGADRDRHVLQPLRLTLRGDDDVLDARIGGGGIGIDALRRGRFLSGAVGGCRILRGRGSARLCGGGHGGRHGEGGCGKQFEFLHDGLVSLSPSGLAPVERFPVFGMVELASEFRRRQTFCTAGNCRMRCRDDSRDRLRN